MTSKNWNYKTNTHVEWVSNIVLVLKKNGKLRNCIYFRNMNLATSKDECPMLRVDILINSTTKNEILNFMDDHLHYNKIFIVEENLLKIDFKYTS